MSFADSALRHREDARYLAVSQRYQNAGHLIGFAAECLVKAEMERAGITVDKNLRAHFPDLTQKIQTHAAGRLAGALWGVVGSPKFLNGWRADRRYDADLPAVDASDQYRGWENDVNDLFRAVRGTP